MAPKKGSEIGHLMERLGDHGFAVTVETEDELHTHCVSGNGFRLRVDIGPKGILLDFVVGRNGESPELRYSIDTDLYDTSDSAQRWFADEILRDIASFLDALGGGGLQVSRARGRTAIVFPHEDKYVRVERGRVFTRRHEYEHVSDAEGGDTFQPFGP
ncbi:hypothetical protein AB0B85_32165 [Micromonospora sp. NPDC049044]|uniref:hypothetical protein n=1 Tax=unclassified Micromonospora TaxID=2617518 RepID=UPI0033DB4EE1